MPPGVATGDARYAALGAPAQARSAPPGMPRTAFPNGGVATAWHRRPGKPALFF